MRAALKEAEKAFRKEEIPVGTVSVMGGKIIARAQNLKEMRQDATAHAEILCLQKTFKKLKRWRLSEVLFFSTLEPCAMCAGALVQARIGKLVYATKDPKAGAAGSIIDLLQEKAFNHRIPVEAGLLEKESRDLLQSFFAGLRKRGKRKKRKKIG